MFEFVLIFELFMFDVDIFDELPMFELLPVIGVDIGVGLATVVFIVLVFIRLVLLAVLLAPVSPHPAANAPIANTAVSAIFFMILCDLLSSSKLYLSDCCQRKRCFAPKPIKYCLEQWSL